MDVCVALSQKTSTDQGYTAAGHAIIYDAYQQNKVTGGTGYYYYAPKHEQLNCRIMD